MEIMPLGDNGCEMAVLKGVEASENRWISARLICYFLSTGRITRHQTVNHMCFVESCTGVFSKGQQIKTSAKDIPYSE